LITAWVVPPQVIGQTPSIRGVVTDASGVPLAGATILVVELAVGSATDTDGLYSIEIPPSQATSDPVTLRVQFIGFRTEERVISLRAGEQVQDFELALDPLNLDQIVVTGIASERSKATSEVSVSHLDTGELLEHNSYQDLTQLMAGKIPGVMVQASSGNVGGGIRFLMRSSTGLNGNGQPVIYLDGVRINSDEYRAIETFGQGTSLLAGLNPEDIESIDVLPGPAGAALYGTSGSNGVILIKTKRGQYGSAPSITYKSTLGVNQQAQEFTRFNAAFPDDANDFFDDGTILQHSFGISGGAPALRYYASMDLRNEDGHFATNTQDRKSFRLNLESIRGDNLSVRLNSSLSVTDNIIPGNDDFLLGYLYNATILPVPFPFVDREFLDEAFHDKHITRSTLGVQAEYTPLTNVVLNGSVGFDRTHVDETYAFGYIATFGARGAKQVVQKGIEQYTYDFNGRYSRSLPGKIESTSILGTQLFDRRSTQLSIARSEFASLLITNVGAASLADFNDEEVLQRREAGVYFQQELIRDQTYFLTLGLRRDFASSIGAGSSSIYYPKFSTAVRLDQAVTLPSMFTFLKARVAYGATGQLPRHLANSGVRWQAEPSGYGSAGVIGFVGNRSVKPERVTEIEFGLEAEVADNLGIELTYYRQDVKDSIIDFISAPSTGLASSPTPVNIGASSGKGFEASIHGSAYRSRSLSVDLTLVWNYQTNEVEDMGGAPPILDMYYKINAVAAGLPRSAFRDFSSHATFDSNGLYTGAAISQSDTDGDGAPDAALMGIPYPEHNGSFGVNIEAFQHLSTRLLFEWNLGNSVFNNTLFNQSFNGTHYERNQALVQLGLVSAGAVGLGDEYLPFLRRGTKEYIEAATFVAETEAFPEGVRAQGNFVEKADFIKLREISVRYDFSDLLKRSGYGNHVEAVSLTLSARNLWKSTKYKGLDPEVNVFGANDLTRGVDFNTLPQPRVLSATISMRF